MNSLAFLIVSILAIYIIAMASTACIMLSQKRDSVKMLMCGIILFMFTIFLPIFTIWMIERNMKKVEGIKVPADTETEKIQTRENAVPRQTPGSLHFYFFITLNFAHLDIRCLSGLTSTTLTTNPPILYPLFS